MKIQYPEIGICGLSCRLCPMYNTGTDNRCSGCKSPTRMKVGCPFITCAIKKKGIEFCWDCEENDTCEKWQNHREAGKRADSFKCYQALEADISFILINGVAKFNDIQIQRSEILKEMLQEFNEGRSKSYYCIACTVLAIEELHEALKEARKMSKGSTIKEKSRILHSLLDQIAHRKGYTFKLRKST